jgi:hypothetical protein
MKILYNIEYNWKMIMKRDSEKWQFVIIYKYYSGIIFMDWGKQPPSTNTTDIWTKIWTGAFWV